MNTEAMIVRDVCQAELISYLETIRDTTECEATRVYCETVIYRKIKRK